ncbi:Crp/Fnr family transcriptional regulator [bacterium]|nr:MAG: Crp/Fnr family transcriptional regulator [bacterium]
MHQLLLQTLQTIAPLQESEIDQIKASFHVLKLKKGDLFLKSGEVSQWVGFINSGLVRYFVMKNGDESTFEFTKEGEFVSDYQSFLHQKPSLQHIQAIEDTELLVINREDVLAVFTRTLHGNLLGRVIVEHRFGIMVDQLLAVYMQNEEERYMSFISNYSDLVQRIPQYMIASYVGVKPQSLSRIRRRFAGRS